MGCGDPLYQRTMNQESSSLLFSLPLKLRKLVCSCLCSQSCDGKMLSWPNYCSRSAHSMACGRWQSSGALAPARERGHYLGLKMHKETSFILGSSWKEPHKHYADVWQTIQTPAHTEILTNYLTTHKPAHLKNILPEAWNAIT